VDVVLYVPLRGGRATPSACEEGIYCAKPPAEGWKGRRAHDPDLPHDEEKPLTSVWSADS
jgi:hypothetical protein